MTSPTPDKKVKLSQKQKELLGIMQTGVVCGCSGWTEGNKHKFRGPTVESLRKLGLIRPCRGMMFTYEITEKGKSIKL